MVSDFVLSEFREICVQGIKTKFKWDYKLSREEKEKVYSAVSKWFNRGIV